MMKLDYFNNHVKCSIHPEESELSSDHLFSIFSALYHLFNL